MRCTVLTLVALLLGCKDKRPESPPPPPVPRDGVTLLQPGTPPLQVLRYRLTKGARTTSELVYDLETRSDDQSAPAAQAHGSGGGPTNPAAGQAGAASKQPGSGSGAGSDQGEGQTGPSPTLIVTLETVVDDVLADGTARLRVTVLGTRVRERAGSAVSADLLRGQAAVADGVVFTEMLAPDGKISEARVETAANLTPKAKARLDSLLQTLERVAMQLPAEPVGVGASWRERKALPEGGIRAVSETTYTLTSLAGSVATYTGTGRSSSTPQTIEQEDLKVEITNPRGHSEAKGTIDLARYAPATTATSTFAAEMSIDAPKGTPGAGKSTVEVSVAIQISPTEGAAAEAPAATEGSGAPAAPSAGSAASAP